MRLCVHIASGASRSPRQSSTRRPRDASPELADVGLNDRLGAVRAEPANLIRRARRAEALAGPVTRRRGRVAQLEPFASPTNVLDLGVSLNSNDGFETQGNNDCGFGIDRGKTPI